MSTPKMLRVPMFFIFTEDLKHFLELDKDLIENFSIKQNHIKLYHSDNNGRERFKRDLFDFKKNARAIYLQSSTIQNRSFDTGNHLNDIVLPWLAKKKVPIITHRLEGNNPSWLAHNFSNSLEDAKIFLRQKMLENNIFLKSDLPHSIAS